MSPVHRALVYTRTTGYRHASIPAGIAALRDLAADAGFAVDATEDPGEFTGPNLAHYKVVVFLSTTGDVLTDNGRSAFRDFVLDGGGFLGVHSAANTETGWDFFGDLIGARFTRHPDFQPGTVSLEDQRHPATAHLPGQWPWTDEWYEFGSNPRGSVRVLASVDERTYQDGRMGTDHPLIWCHENCGSRSFYTALGHADEAYADADFRAHLAGGLTWAARLD
jgi:type 1 glutamine amidotransferase